MGKMKKGLIIGSLLGGVVGSMVTWFNVSKKGKEMREQVLVHTEALYKEIKASLLDLPGPTRDMYEALVERATEEYALKKDLAHNYKNLLLKDLKKKWSALEQEIKQK